MRVVSLFSGIGGLDLGFINQGFDLIYANDNDKFAVQTYRANYKHKIVESDIEDIDPNEILEHDILIGGFPCQPFSMMGKERGFEDTRGTLFFNIVEIIKFHIENKIPPKVIVLENVRRLLTHDKGNTFTVIKSTLEDLGYKIFYKVLNSADYGVPQTRNRIFLICFYNHKAKFEFPKSIKLDKTLHDILEQEVDEKYFLSERIIPTILAHGSKNYYSKSEIDLDIARPLCATMHKMHRANQDNYVTQDGKIRRLTPREAARLQGFPDDFVFPVSDTQAYRQCGNAVTVNVAEAIAKEIKNTMMELNEWK
ncbi:DNA cytosine methyltransferase [Sneathia sanguinegens]|uniref:DNA cytosine methyltransferase n=1 Tax=Sneathia sanguinegens TaxID=40543 RepID=UPI002586EADE|nr:DNA cytosine methyltransferase [Sneathia sanguinegens]MDU4651921.1 DNA cytosine methyltransferase [Sneathia sanguinegens]